MTPLAHEIYAVLRAALLEGRDELTYAELLAALRAARRAHRGGRAKAGPPLPKRPRAPSFFAALTEVTLGCHAAKVPSVAAIVCRSGAHRPGDGFFKIAYPRVRSESGRVAKWRTERDDLLANLTLLPAELPERAS